MLIQNKYDLKLIGNLIVDEIYCIQNWPKEGTSNKYNSHRKSVGGLGNIIRALQTSELKLFIEGPVGNDVDGEIIENFLKEEKIEYKLHKTNFPTSKALILSGLKSTERTSFVDWGCAKENFIESEVSAKWTHYSYLDTINISNLSNKSDIISADLCLSDPSEKEIKETLERLSGIDYLFISESEINSILRNKYNSSLMKAFAKNNNIKYIIYHTRDKTNIISSRSNKDIKSIEPKATKSNVLGAGDYYCANFINYQLNNLINNEKAALFAHNQATKFVLMSNEKI